jgi:hypothetical protein
MPEAKRKAKPNWHGTLHELLSTIVPLPRRPGVNLGHQELSVARDKMAFMLSEQSGGIWVADLPRNIQ